MDNMESEGIKKRYILHEKNIYEFNSATVYEREVYELKGDKIFKTKMLNYLMVDFKRKSINNTILPSKKEALIFLASRRIEDKLLFG